MVTRSEFRDDTAIWAVQCGLGTDDVGQDLCAVANDCSRGLVARGLDAEHFHGFSRPANVPVTSLFRRGRGGRGSLNILFGNLRLFGEEFDALDHVDSPVQLNVRDRHDLLRGLRLRQTGRGALFQ